MIAAGITGTALKGGIDIIAKVRAGKNPQTFAKTKRIFTRRQTVYVPLIIIFFVKFMEHFAPKKHLSNREQKLSYFKF
jgi:hypothetical protein